MNLSEREAVASISVSFGDARLDEIHRALGTVNALYCCIEDASLWRIMTLRAKAAIAAPGTLLLHDSRLTKRRSGWRINLRATYRPGGWAKMTLLRDGTVCRMVMYGARPWPVLRWRWVR